MSGRSKDLCKVRALIRLLLDPPPVDVVPASLSESFTALVAAFAKLDEDGVKKVVHSVAFESRNAFREDRGLEPVNEALSPLATAEARDAFRVTAVGAVVMERRSVGVEVSRNG